MKLHRIEFARLVRDGGERRIVRNADHLEALGMPRDAVAVAHPDRILAAHLPNPVEQRGLAHDFDFGAAEFAVMAALHLSAELGGHRLLSVADAEHRYAGLENRLRGARGNVFS